MKVILGVVGSRGFNDYEKVKEELDKYENIEEITSGGARGADSLAEKYAKDNNIPMKVFPALWKKCGRSAGYRRNIQIVDYSTEIIAFWDGESKGTQHSINLAKKQNKKVKIIIC